MKTLLLNQEDIRKVVNMKDAVEIVEKTFEGYGNETVINPTKVLLDLGETASYPPYEGFMNAMPAYIGWLDTAGIKWVGGFLGERKKAGLPYIMGMILLIDPHLGLFKAAMDGQYITNIRTGGQTAASLKHLLPGKKSITLGLYGAGMQGHTQTLAISEVFDIEEVKVYDIYRPAAEKYAEDMKNVVKKVTVVDDPKEAADADAIVSVTQAKKSFIEESWIKPGTIVFPMGSYQECCDDCILKADKVIVDHVGQAMHRGALKHVVDEGKFTESDLYGTIGEVVAGKKAGRENSQERIVCIPIGTGAMDVAVATVAYERALKEGLGEAFEFVKE